MIDVPSMIFWSAWLALIAVSFGAYEGFAIKTGRTTLSRYVWTLSKDWPPFPWVVGVLTGGLAVHFFWIAQDCPVIK